MSRIAKVTADAPAPAGPYSQSVRIGTIVASAGQGGITPNGDIVSGVTGQTTQALQNIAAALKASGAGLDDVISVRVFLSRRSDFVDMNKAYASFFSEPYPARTTVYVGLPDGLLVEIDALAVTPPA